MGRVRTPILGGPRPSSGQRRAQPDYTLICEEPVTGTALGTLVQRPDGELRRPSDPCTAETRSEGPLRRRTCSLQLRATGCRQPRPQGRVVDAMRAVLSQVEAALDRVNELERRLDVSAYRE